MKRYIEFSVYLPFFVLIDDTDEELLGASNLEELMKELNISLNITELYNVYLSYGNGPYRAGKGDVFVFFKNNDMDSFILIDLFNDFTDQHNMVKLGVRCETIQEKQIRDILFDLHSKTDIKSKIKESYDDFLKLEIIKADYPKEIQYGSQKYIKKIYYNITKTL
ncbi:hypothetical protein M3650_04415 [Paenibacillus sp. MER TA 81-3]|uniref:hypothetical protein n=1 Tax=Paenibacillus sp. MER TA 81-3 TaxID=2939573 RepID=UPI002041B4EC|nr:hypothetical protein [Paenibacillus sp. MER TA 81-3]MCM3337895.1 hypothetical protein [Paenibacillus sp. MER TA 81-3]